MESPSAECVLQEMNALLRNELACVSLYELAIAELGEDADPSVREELGELGRAHCRHTRTLREEVLRLGGVPAPDGENAWAAEPDPPNGADAVLRALSASEESAIRRYESAAARLPGACRALVLEVLLPARRRNLIVLRALESGAGHGACTPVPQAEGVPASPLTKEVTL